MKDTETRSDFFHDFIFIVFSNYFEYKFVNVGFFLFDFCICKRIYMCNYMYINTN